MTFKINLKKFPTHLLIVVLNRCTTCCEETKGVKIPMMKPDYVTLLETEYEKTVPKHLHWQMGNFLSNSLNGFVTCSLYDGMKNKALSDPNVEGREWLSLFVIYPN